MLIAIDAGHGGKDPGAIGFGINEKDITLKLTKLVEKELLNRYEVNVLQIRKADETIELSDRDDIADKAKADFYLSLHTNAAVNKTAKGFESFRHTNAGEKTKAIHSILHKQVMKYLSACGVVDRGIKSANFSVLRETEMPAVLLENLFISNPEDNTKLKDNLFLTGLAQAIATGLAEALKLKRKEPVIVDKIYKVQVGAFSNRAFAEKLAKDLKAKGYSPLIVEVKK
ncbi:MAG TPA: N-acetylmuramoyl-L-alanine amidase [Flavobacterium sp.]|nr:N-acetylmuramoyl-L-alanine amidase [Flavobacterium sp.]